MIGPTHHGLRVQAIEHPRVVPLALVGHRVEVVVLVLARDLQLLPAHGQPRLNHRSNPLSVSPPATDVPLPAVGLQHPGVTGTHHSGHSTQCNLSIFLTLWSLLAKLTTYPPCFAKSRSCLAFRNRFLKWQQRTIATQCRAQWRMLRTAGTHSAGSRLTTPWCYGHTPFGRALLSATFPSSSCLTLWSLQSST